MLFFVYALLNDDTIVKQSMNLNHIKRKKNILKIIKLSTANAKLCIVLRYILACIYV